MWMYLLLSTVYVYGISHMTFSTQQQAGNDCTSFIMPLKWTVVTSRNDRPPLIKEDANVYKNVSNVA